MQEVISSLPKEHVAKKVADVTFSKLEFKNPSNMVCFCSSLSFPTQQYLMSTHLYIAPMSPGTDSPV